MSAGISNHFSLYSKRVRFYFVRCMFSNGRQNYESAPKNNLTVFLAEKLLVEQFSNKNISDPNQSARHLLAHALGCNVNTMVNNLSKTLTIEEKFKLEQMAMCRLAKMPVQYIIGEWDFLDLTLKMMPPVFIPRPETESLVLLASKLVPEAEHCLDIGCGSGTISLALLNRHPQLLSTAIDVNPFACELTLANAQLLKLDDRISVINATIQQEGVVCREEVDFNQKFDFIISNPPYIKSEDVHRLDSEILLYEDFHALDGGFDGCDIIRLILKHSYKWLRPGGYIFMESDPNQVPIIEEIAKKSIPNYTKFSFHPDCYGVHRLSVIQLK